MKLFFYFAIFTVLAVWAQFFLPATDFFTPGLVTLLQFGYIKPALWAGLAWMLIQEGTGGLSFGTMILIYSGLLIYFYFGGIFFEVSNVIFNLLLFIFLAFFKTWIVSIMASLQDLALQDQFRPESIIIQAGVYFLVWFATFYFFKKHFSNEPV